MFEDIDPQSPTPLYEQIASRIRVAIASGELEPGEAVPSVRSLASELRINPATVVQAYRDLEREGFVRKKQGAGTFVEEVPPSRRSDERLRQARELVDRLLTDAARRGVGRDELVQAFATATGMEASDG